MAATQRPWGRRRGGQTLGPAGVAVHPLVVPAGRPGPSHPAGRQRFMAERGNAWIEEVTASHASMVSQPEAVARLILGALEETSRSQP